MTIRTLLMGGVLASALSALPIVSTGTAYAQDRESGVVRDAKTARLAVSRRYVRGSLYRFVLGTGYRPLWESEIELPVLDLAREGGGLTPTRRFGGLQTPVLGFSGEDGRLYTFRGTDKNPSAVLDPLLRDTIVQILVQDQMAAQHPGGPPVAGVISEASGVATIRERMVVMPDDPRLGEFRSEFAGMAGTFFEYPRARSEHNPGFHGATEIIDHEELYDRLARIRPDLVDVEAFLRARLLDLLLGDFDRHRKQWRWAKIPGKSGLQPIPEDRDMAFVRYDGLGLRIASIFVPILQNYGPKYPFIKGLTLHGWEQDRWLLAHLDWSRWEPIVADLQARISDGVIERALATLPPEYAELDGDRLGAAIRGRRDDLAVGARRFYEHLAKEVDVQASDLAEDVLVERSPDGRLLVRIVPRGAAPDAPPLYLRRFSPDETHEVRIYLRGGDDVVQVRGGRGPIVLRVIAGPGEKRLDDSAGGGTLVYDEGGAMEVTYGPHTCVDRSPYTPPESSSGFVDVENVPPRDWGFDLVPFPQFSYQKDVGVFVGVGGLFTRYGFRRHAWSHRHKLSVGWATEANQPRGHYTGVLHAENASWIAQLDLGYSGIEIVRYYGLGNLSPDDGGDAFYRVRNQQARIEPSLAWASPGNLLRLRGGVLAEFSRTKPGRRNIDLLDPYGAGDFGSTGLQVQVQIDTRETVEEAESELALPLHEQPAAGYPTGGMLLDVRSRLTPPLWDIDETTGSIEGSIAGFLSPGEEGRVVLTLRAGGKQTFGKYPYFAAAYIGGSNFFSGEPTLRGFRAQRFAGDASVYGNAEVRVMLGRMKLIVPTDVGVLGFADVGRVFLSGEASKLWHASGGGGVWFAPLVRTNAMSLTVAGSEEDVLVYLRLGFHY